MGQIYLIVLEFIFVVSKDIAVPNGQDANFLMTLDPLPAEKTEPVSIVNPVGGNVLSISQKGFQAAEGYFDRIDTPIYNNGTIAFILTNVRKADAGTYTAEYTGGKSTAKLRVLGRPKTPTITIIKSPILSKTMKINCSSVSTSAPSAPGPSLQYKWKLDEKLANVSNRVLYVNETLKMRDMSLEDTGKQVQCLAYETESLMSEPSEQFIIDVYHPPINLTLTPNIDNYRLSPSKSIPDVTCSAICNPSCRFKWEKEHDEDFQMTGSVLVLGNVSIQDTGMYFCSVNNNVSTVHSLSVKVFVTEIPGQPHIVEISPPEENGNLILKCARDGYNTYNIKEHRWKVEPNDPSIIQRKIHLNSSFVLPMPNKNDRGKEIRCMSVTVERYSSLYSDPYVIVPTYGPRNVTVTPDGPMIFVANLSDLPTVTCTADCNPRCTASWFYSESHVLINNGSELEHMQIGESYYCQTRNKYGSKMSSNITIQSSDGNNNEKQNWNAIKIATISSVTSVAFIIIVTLTYCILVWVKKRQKKRKTKLALQKIRKRLNEIESKTATNHEDVAEDIENEDEEENDNLTNNVKAHGSNSQNQLEMDESSNDISSVSNRTYDYADYCPDYQNDYLEYSSYEELHNVRKSPSYKTVGLENETGQTKEINMADNESNMADDEISSSLSEEQ